MTFENEELVAPIYLSTIAGLSTTLGAAVIYFLPVKNVTMQVPAGAMSFSLALAGSVMMTISFVSIIPQCLIDKSQTENGETSNTFLPLGWTLMIRVISFLLGAGVYFILSWCMTEPEQLLQDNIDTLVGSQNDSSEYDDTSVDNDIQLEEQRFLTESIRNRHVSSTSRSSSSNSLAAQQTNNEISNSSFGGKQSMDVFSCTIGKDLNKEHRKAWR